MGIHQVIANGSDVYQLTSSGKVRKFRGLNTDEHWEELDHDKSIVQLAAGKFLYSRRSTGQIFMWNSNEANWDMIDGAGDAEQIAATEYLIAKKTKNHKICLYNGKEWPELTMWAYGTGALTSAVEILASNGILFTRAHCDGSDPFWYRYYGGAPFQGWRSISGRSTDIICGAAGENLWVGAPKDDGMNVTVWRRRDTVDSYGYAYDQNVTNFHDLAKIAGGPAGVVALTKSGEVWLWLMGVHWRRLSADTSNQGIAVGDTFYVWNEDSGIYSWSGQGWTKLQAEIDD